MAKTANAHTHTSQTTNAMTWRRASLSNGANTTALAIASSATKASITTTGAVERKPWLVIGGAIPKGLSPLTCRAHPSRRRAKMRSPNFALTAF